MKRFFKFFAVIIFTALILWVFVYLYKKTKTSPVVFETEQAQTIDIINKTVATGSVIPRREIAIKPQENGIIREIFVDPGDVVKEGDLIARIQIIPEMIEVNAAESRLNKAQLEYENARVEFERKKELFEQQVIARSEFEAEELKYRTRLEDLNAADNHLQLIQEGVTRKMGAQTNTLIRSTTDGMILDVPVREGNSVIRSNAFNEGTTIALIADMSEMIFEGHVDETEVGKVREGMLLTLTIGALQGHTFDALLEYISPKGREESGAIQFEIRAAVTLQEDFFIRSGYSANADIVFDRRDSVLAVNEKVLQFREDIVFVEVETAPQEFEERVIKIGLSDGINTEVLEGLNLEDKIKIPGI